MLDELRRKIEAAEQARDVLEAAQTAYAAHRRALERYGIGSWLLVDVEGTQYRGLVTGAQWDQSFGREYGNFDFEFFVLVTDGQRRNPLHVTLDQVVEVLAVSPVDIGESEAGNA